MEILSEHTCQGWLEGYLLTGRHGLFSCYEAFVHIVDSMVNQHTKWLKVARELPWRRPIASLNYLLTSHVWRQDHNGFSHQDPGFIDHVLNKSPGRTGLSAAGRQHPAVGGRPLPAQPRLHQRRRRRQAALLRLAGHGGGRARTAPAAPGSGSGRATTAAIPTWSWPAPATCPPWRCWPPPTCCSRHLPKLRVRVVNVVDLIRLPPPTEHPHGMTDAEYDALFTTDKPVIFAYHGYPWLIHRLAYRRHGHDNLHVRGYKEEGTTTTPFDMVVLNDLDRYRLVMDVIDRVPGLALRAAAVRQPMVDNLTRHHAWIRETGTDLPEVADWTWPGQR